jgi:hypothetical protein
MLGLVIGIAVVLGVSQQDHAAPVFRSDVSVVAIELLVFEGRVWCRGTKPHVGLTIKDFSLRIDNKNYRLAEAKEDADEPGRYRLTFSPPEDLRDERPHRVAVGIQRRGVAVRMVTIPKEVSANGPIGPTVVCCPKECKGQ